MRFESDGTTTTIVDQLTVSHSTPQTTSPLTGRAASGSVIPGTPATSIPARKRYLAVTPSCGPTPARRHLGLQAHDHRYDRHQWPADLPDQRTLYIIQTSPERRELRAYDILADGSLGAISCCINSAKTTGAPSGVSTACASMRRGTFVATAGSYASGPGPMIYIWDTRGRVLETHPMPVGVDTPTNCTFGDPDQRTLYITTGGGHLFRVRNTGRRGWIIWPPVR